MEDNIREVVDNTKPKAARYAEGIFCIVYLLFVITIVCVSYKEYDRIAGDMNLHRQSLRFSFAFMMALLLLIGDGFHLVPRVIVAFRGSMRKQDLFLGLGNLISSVTMTFFYNVLLKMGDSVEYHESKYNMGIEKAILVFTIIRVCILLLPMNRWFSKEGSKTWAIIRNVFFVMIGVLTVVGFFRVIAYASTMPSTFYMIIIAMVILSFAFYLPVAIFGKENPKLGMLMMPKTLCYMAMLGIIVFWPI